jgi:PAS domain S-box-containing protein
MSTRPTLAALRPLRRTLLGQALDNAGAAAFVFDREGTLVAANEAALSVTGYSWDDLFALDSSKLMTKPARQGARLARVVDGSLHAGRGSIRRKDGTAVKVDFQVERTAISGDDVPYYLSLCHPREQPPRS